MNNVRADLPRIMVALCGDVTRDPESIIKYGVFLESLGCRFSIPAIYDAKLYGLQLLISAIPVWHPDLNTWRARTHKSVDGFVRRSRGASRRIRGLRGQVDLVLQLGVLFDAGWDDSPVPSVIYTDYTASMSANHPEAGRSPFHGMALEHWLELERKAMQRARQVCVRSRAVKQSLIEDYSLPPDHITIIGGGLNLSQLPGLPPHPADRPPTALFIGLDFYRKGGDLVLKAFALARESVPNAQLLFVSAGSIPSGLPLAGVKIFPPIWDREQFLSLYPQADLLVLPSRLETWGDVLLEAMAYGLPCIGVAGQPMEEIIRHEQTGLLVPPERVDALAESLTYLFTQPQLRERMGNAGRDLVARDFTWERVADRITPILESASCLKKSDEVLSKRLARTGED